MIDQNAYHSIYVGLYLVGRYLAVLLEYDFGVGRELIAQLMVVPRPGNAPCTFGHRPIKHFRHRKVVFRQLIAY